MGCQMDNTGTVTNSDMLHWAAAAAVKAKTDVLIFVWN